MLFTTPGLSRYAALRGINRGYHPAAHRAETGMIHQTMLLNTPLFTLDLTTFATPYNCAVGCYIEDPNAG
jgi:hypothetical protein